MSIFYLKMRLKMKLKALLMILFLSFFTMSFSAFSQEENAENKDTTKTAENPKWDDFENVEESDFESDEGWSYWMNSSEFPSKIDHPTIEVVYGITQPSIDESEFDGEFRKLGNLEIRLGYSEIKDNFFSENITEFDNSYFFVGNSSEEIMTNKEDGIDKIASDEWRFGFAWGGGYAYKLGNGYNVLLYHNSGMKWSKLNFHDEAPNQKSKAAMNAYGDAIRFGKMFESGVKVHLFDYITLGGGFQRSMVYPRHMFWYWTASELISGIGHGLVDAFIDDIVEASPYAGPIVYAVLHTGISYGMYELQKKDMNWPIDTHAPFFNEGFQVSFSFTF
jgi:hypothetical protein